VIIDLQPVHKAIKVSVFSNDLTIVIPDSLVSDGVAGLLIFLIG
jgi:hypothetical protein